MEKIIKETIYETTLKGYSIVSDSPITIIGERIIEKDGKVLEQYLYNIDGYETKNGLPFVSLKANLIVEEKKNKLE